MLSRWPDANKGEEDKQDLILLPLETFICLTEEVMQEVTWRICIDEDCTKRDILRQYHDHPTAGHLGRDVTFQMINQTYWWAEVKGCVICQQNKNLMHWQKVPLYCILSPPGAQPFEIIFMDLITQLLKSNGKDAILTIVDYGCTRATTFLPCTITIMA